MAAAFSGSSDRGRLAPIACRQSTTALGTLTHLHICIYTCVFAYIYIYIYIYLLIYFYIYKSSPDTYTYIHCVCVRDVTHFAFRLLHRQGHLCHRAFARASST